MLTIGMVTIDCADPQRLTSFWTAALDTQVVGDYGDFVLLGDRAGVAVALQRVPEPMVGKNRVHLDLRPSTSLEEEVERLIGLGASHQEDHRMPGLRWSVLTDPEGTVFCVGTHDEAPNSGSA